MYRSESALARLGLRPGETIRFKRNDRGRYIVGRVEGIETDGSVAVRDPDGSARSLRAERVEIRRPGPLGRLRWQIVSDVAVTWQQLELFERAPEPAGDPGPRITIRRRRPKLFDPDATGAHPTEPDVTGPHPIARDRADPDASDD